MSWATRLVQAAFRGVSFDCLSVEDPFEHRLAEFEYPGRRGADLDGLGLRARPTKFVAVFYGRDYLADLERFLAKVVEGQTGPFLHPLFGTWQAKVASAVVRHEAGKRNYAEVEVEVKEDGTGDEPADLFAVAEAEDELEAAAELATYESERLGTDSTEVAAAISDAESFAGDVIDAEEEASTRLDQLRAHVNGAIDALERDPTITDLEARPLVAALRACALAGRDLHEQLEALRPAVIEHELRATVPLSVLANALYGDPSREAELRRLNRVRNPFLAPVGREVRVYAS